MEIISRNKGRPRVFDDEELAAAATMIAGGVAPAGAKSHRQMQRFRTGKSNPPDTGELSDEVIRAVDDYATRHPGITPGQALEALRLAIRTVASDRERAWEERSPGAAEPRSVPDHPTS